MSDLKSEYNEIAVLLLNKETRVLGIKLICKLYGINVYKYFLDEIIFHPEVEFFSVNRISNEFLVFLNYLSSTDLDGTGIKYFRYSINQPKYESYNYFSLMWINENI